ncbi:hypothetical protein KFU94_38370 [Chloroflexi bacterium TSY]|nr:hypothetical protein [Chloroflexi bacterium TSY]
MTISNVFRYTKQKIHLIDLIAIEKSIEHPTFLVMTSTYFGLIIVLVLVIELLIVVVLSNQRRIPVGTE